MNYPKLNMLAIAAAFLLTAKAQAQIVGKSTDSNYYNTTIIYKKGDLKDNEILQKVENDYGMGDIIRIADAPAKPKVEPVNLAPQKAVVINTTRKPVVQPVTTAQPAIAVAPKVVKPAPIAEKTMVVAPAKEELKQIKSAPSVKTASATGSKSVKEVKKKSGSSKMRYKAPKKTKQRGKQRYGCPKF